MATKPRGLRRKGKVWHAYAFMHGRQVECSMRTERLTEARARRAAWVTSIREGRSASTAALTVDDLLDQYVEHRARLLLSWRTERTRLLRISSEIGERLVDDLSSQDVEELVASWRATLSAPTSNRLLARWKAMWRYARDTGLVSADTHRRMTTPVMLRENPGRLRYLTPEEEARILSHADEWLGLALTIAIDTGLRRGELLRLRWSDLDLARSVMWVGRTKSGRPRGIPLVSRVASLLLRTPRRGSLVLATGRKAKPDEALRRAWESARTAARLEDVHWHDLRHTYASRLAMAGATERDLMDLLGHSSSAMAQRYVHLSPTRLHDLSARAAEAAPDLPEFCQRIDGRRRTKKTIVSAEARFRPRLAR